MKHSFSSGKTDDADATLVRPSNWNATHIKGYTALSSNTTLDSTHDYIAATAGASGITITLPTAASDTGRTYTIQKVDSAAGTVTVATTSSQTISGPTTRLLATQWDSITVVSNGANWNLDTDAVLDVNKAGEGYWAPFGIPAHLQNQAYTASRFFFFQFVLPYKVTINRVNFYNGTALAANKGIRWSVWNTSFDTLLCKSNVIVPADTPGSAVVTKTMSTACTLQPGVYYVGFGTDDGAATFSQYNLTTFSPVGGMLNQNSVIRVGYCTNTMTGSGGTLDFPSSCGARTADLSNFLPQLVWEP